MGRDDYEIFARHLCHELGRKIGKDENLFLFSCNDNTPSGYACIKELQCDYQQFYTRSPLPGNNASDHTYYIMVRELFPINFLTETLVFLLTAYLEALWCGRYDEVNLKSEYEAKVVVHNLLNQFIDRFMNITGINLWMLDDLSHIDHESEKCQGTLLFFESEELACVETEVITENPIRFCDDELRRIRKLMSGGKGYALVFVKKKSSYEPSDSFVLKGYTKQIQNEGWTINISHPGVFTVSMVRKPLFQMNHLCPQPVQIEWHQQLLNVCRIFGVTNKAKNKKLYKLLEQIEKQGHGAAVIFLNLKTSSGAEKRLNNLFRLERGYAVSGKLMAAQTAMDGAIVVDVETGKIAYFGVIVDGIARKRGDMSRGSRHNSLDTFVCDFHAQHTGEPVAAIVFSEDGGSTFYCPEETND